jgi:hypothetical protein
MAYDDLPPAWPPPKIADGFREAHKRVPPVDHRAELAALDQISQELKILGGSMHRHDANLLAVTQDNTQQLPLNSRPGSVPRGSSLAREEVHSGVADQEPLGRTDLRHRNDT